MANNAASRLLLVALGLLVLSGWLLCTLVLGEPYLELDRNAMVEESVAIALPAVAGVVAGVLAVRRHRHR